MAKALGMKCRECGEMYPVSPIHVCELCFGPLEVALLQVLQFTFMALMSVE